MRFRLVYLAVVVITAALLTGGCGSSSHTSHTVGLSILAPTSGATVGVRTITVAGTVSPSYATVTVGGQPAQVVDGSFSRRVQLGPSSQTITITGQASGYGDGVASTTVQYSPKLAATFAASQIGENPGSAKGDKKGASKDKSKAKKQSGSKSALSTSGSSKTSTSSSSSSSAPSQPTFPSSSKPAASNPAPSKPAATPTPSKPAPSHPSASTHHTSPPVNHATHTAPLSVKQIKKLWIAGCMKAGNGQAYGSYCRCTYHHLERAGALQSRSRLDALNRKLERYHRTHDYKQLPKYVREAMSICGGKLPPVITKLPVSEPSSPPALSATGATSTTGVTSTTGTTSATGVNSNAGATSAAPQVRRAKNRRSSRHRRMSKAQARELRLKRSVLHKIEFMVHVLVADRPVTAAPSDLRSIG